MVCISVSIYILHIHTYIYIYIYIYSVSLFGITGTYHLLTETKFSCEVVFHKSNQSCTKMVFDTTKLALLLID